MSSLIGIASAMGDKIRSAIDASTLYSSDLIAMQVEPLRNLNPTPPSIDIYPADPFTFTDADGFGDVSVGLLFTVRARIDAADHDAGQELLLALLDDEDALSVAVALEADQTLAGTVSSVHVQSRSGFRLYEDVPGQGALLGCEWTVGVLSSPVFVLEPGGPIASALSYTAYVPELTTLGTLPTLGTDAVQEGRFIRSGPFVHTWGLLQFGTGSSPGVGNYAISLPVAPVTDMRPTILGDATSTFPVGQATFFSMSSGFFLRVTASILDDGAVDAGKLVFEWSNDPTGDGPEIASESNPWPWDDGDTIRWSATYEAQL